MTRTLPLVPFEQYMLAEDTAEFPRSFFLELTFTGAADRAALARAWLAALERHPLLTASLSSNHRQWQLGGHAPPEIDFADETAPVTFPGAERIDLVREPGVRGWVRVGSERTRIVLQFHHSCCDGNGCIRFVAEWLTLYAQATSPSRLDVELPALDPALLAGRGTFGLARATFREFLGHVRYMIVDSLHLLARRVIVIEPPAVPAAPATLPGVETITLDPAEFAALRQLAKQAGVTLNDWFLGHLFPTILDWNTALGAPPTRGWVRVNVPTDLRRPEDQAMPAANVMSFTFIDRRPSDCRKGEALMISIARETRAIKERRLGLYFIAELALLAGIPWALRFVLRRQRAMATAVLSNVGDIGRAFSPSLPRENDKLVLGNLVLETFVGAPPLRPLTHVGVAMLTYAGRLQVAARCGRQGFGGGDARRFLDMYLARIRAALH
jgi:hypothetical protein